MTPRLPVLAILAFSLLGPPSSVLAQKPDAARNPTQADAPVRESAEVVLVEVPVRVVDKNGVPVRGLQANQFELFDDGKKQDIVGFDTIDLAQKTLDRQPLSEALNPAARRHFLILFDLTFARPGAILAAQRAAKQFVLGGMTDRDFAAVATFTVEKGVRMLVTFSSDRVQLARGRHARFDDRGRHIQGPPRICVRHRPGRRHLPRPMQTHLLKTMWSCLLEN